MILKCFASISGLQDRQLFLIEIQSMMLLTMEEIPLLRQLIKAVVIAFSITPAAGSEVALGVLSPCGGIYLEDVIRVPLIRLLVNPMAYEGRCIATSGFMSFSMGRDYIYLTKEDYEKKRKNLAALLSRPDAIDESLYDDRYYKDREGVIIGVVENMVGGTSEKTVFHVYKTQAEIFEAADSGVDD